MRKETWIRLGLASATLAIAGVGSMACSSDDTNVTVGTADGGVVDSGKPVGSDAGDAGEVTPPDTTPPKLSFFHAGANLGAVQFCIGASISPNQFPLNTPLPAFPGLPAGFGGVADIPAANAGVIPSVTLTPFLVDIAAAAAAGDGGAPVADCNALIPDQANPPAFAYKLADITAGTLAAGHSYLGAVVGCTKDGLPVPPSDTTHTGVTYSQEKCGADWTADNGNLKLSIVDLPTTAQAEGSIGIQVANLSSQTSTTFKGGVLAAFFPAPAADAGTVADAGTAPTWNGAVVSPTPIGTAPFAYSETPASPLAPAPTAVSGAPADGTGWYIGIWSAAGITGPAIQAYPLSSSDLRTLPVLALSPNVKATGFQDKANYTFVFSGDLNANGLQTGATPVKDPTIHFVVLANDPPVAAEADAGAAL